MAEGGSKIQLEDVKQTVTCGICLQLFTDPRSLSCSHSYCLVCLQHLQKGSSAKECPVCRASSIPPRRELESLTANKLAADLVKLVVTYEPDYKGKITRICYNSTRHVVGDRGYKLLRNVIQKQAGYGY